MGDRSISVDLLGDAEDLGAALDAAAEKLTRLAEKVKEASGVVDIPVNVENAEADAKLDETKRKKDEASGDTKFKVNADTSDGTNNLHLMAVAIAALIPIAVAAAGAVAGIGAVGLAGVAAVAAGFSGIGTAVQAMGQQASAGGAAVKVSADAVRSATEQVNQSVIDYQHSLDSLAAAERGVTAAAADVAAAQRDVATAVANVGTAEQSLTDANRTATEAQQALNDAYKQAAQNLEDLQIQSEDMALSQQDAALAVQEAQANAATVDANPLNGPLQRQRAQLQVAEAQQRVVDLQNSANKLADTKATADAKGVAGSDLVTQAQDRLTAANEGVAAASQRVAQAQQAVADAQAKVVDAVQKEADANLQVQYAHENVAKAVQAETDARIKLNEAQHPQASSSGGVDPVAAAMAKLTPAGREFATFLRGFIDGPLKQLMDAGQQAFLPGVEAGMKAIEPAMKALQPTFAAFSKTAGDALGGLVKVLAPLAKPFLDFANAALQGLAPLQPILALFAQQLGAVFEQLVKSGDAQRMMSGLSQIIGALLPILPPLIDAGVKVAAALGPALAIVVQDLGQAIVAILPSIVKLAPSFAQLLEAVAPLLPPLGQLIAAVVQLLPPLIAILLPIIQFQVALTSGLISAFSDVVNWIQQHIIPTWNSFNTTATTVHTAIVNGLQAVVNFITGMPGKVSAALSSFFSPLVTGFKAAINEVIRGWDSLSFTLPGGSFLGMNWSSFTFGVPQIPQLASGGIVTGPTLAMIGEAGPEAVVPLTSVAGQQALGGGGLTVNISNAVVGGNDAIQRVVVAALAEARARGLLPASLAATVH